MVTMSSFVVMVHCILHEKTPEKQDHLCNYVIMKKLQALDSEYIICFSNLISVMILIGLFCNFISLCVLKPQSKMLLLLPNQA